MKAQTIDSISITQPIICHGDFATATAYINQTSPPTSLSYVLQFQNQFGFWVQLGFSAQGTGTTSPFTGLFAGTLELVKEGNIIIKQSKLFENIFIKEKNE